MTLLKMMQRRCGWFTNTLSAIVIGMAILFFPQNGLALSPEEAYKAGNESYQRNDWMTAITQLRQAAKAQHIPAMLLLAYILDRAEEDADAVRWYRKAAMMNSAEAAMELGIMVANGYGVKKNSAKGVEWITRAAKLGHHPATMLLASAYIDGKMGIRPDLREAQKWLELAARDGFAPAIKELARMGKKVTKKAPQETESRVTANPQKEVGAALKIWARAWSEKNLAAYRGAYASHFRPLPTFDRKDKTIQVTLGKIRITLEGDKKARATFEQDYKSENRKKKTKKVLSLLKEDGGWKIVKEERAP